MTTGDLTIRWHDDDDNDDEYCEIINSANF